MTADDLAVGGVELIAGLPRGIESDVRYAIWRNQRMAEKRGQCALRAQAVVHRTSARVHL